MLRWYSYATLIGIFTTITVSQSSQAESDTISRFDKGNVEVDFKPISSDDTRTGSDNEDKSFVDKRGEHSYLHFGKRQDDAKRTHELLHFGKKDFALDDENKRGHNLMHFGKRDSLDDDKRGHNLMHFGKREDADDYKRGHNLMHFGKREDTDDYNRGHNLMHFGKRDEPPRHKIMRFGKRTEKGHNLLHFGKRDDAIIDRKFIDSTEKDKKDGRILMHFVTKDANKGLFPKSRWARSAEGHDNAAVMDLIRELFLQQKEGSKRGHTIMRFGKRGSGNDGHSIMRFGKRDFENGEYLDENDNEDYSQDYLYKDDDKRSGNAYMHFGKRDKGGHAILSFGKRYYDDIEKDPESHLYDESELDNYDEIPSEDDLKAQLAEDAANKARAIIDFGKRGNAMIHFGKRTGNNMLHFGKRDSFDYPYPRDDMIRDDFKREHNILRFGKREFGPTESLERHIREAANQKEAVDGKNKTKTNNPEEIVAAKSRQRRSLEDAVTLYGDGEWTMDGHPSFVLPKAFSTAEVNPFQVPLFLSSFNHIQRAAYPFYRSSRAADKKKNVFLHFGRR